MKANTLNKIEEKIEREQTTRAKTIAQIRKKVRIQSDLVQHSNTSAS